jgi:hypothetical protein
MEFVLLLILFALAVIAYGFIRIARRVYARRDQPAEVERTFLKAILTKPPPKPPPRYTLGRRQPSPPPDQGA